MEYGFVTVVKLVVAVGVLFCCTSCAPMSDIQKAALKGDQGQIDRMLAQGVDINDFSPVHGTPLRIAARQGDMALVKYLVEHGADIDVGSPLTAGSQAGYIHIVQFLLERGADVNNGGWNADSPLWAAAYENHPEVMALLLKWHANPDGNGQAEPLWISSYRGYDDIVRQLLEAGADPNIRDCLDVAVRHSPSDVTTRLLLEFGATVDVPDKWGMTSLHSAAVYGRVERVRLLLEYGADRKWVDKSGKTAEMYALEHDYQDVAKLLNSYY